MWTQAVKMLRARGKIYDAHCTRYSSTYVHQNWTRYSSTYVYQNSTLFVHFAMQYVHRLTSISCPVIVQSSPCPVIVLSSPFLSLSCLHLALSLSCLCPVFTLSCHCPVFTWFCLQLVLTSPCPNFPLSCHCPVFTLSFPAIPFVYLYPCQMFCILSCKLSCHVQSCHPYPVLLISIYNVLSCHVIFLLSLS